MIRVGIAGIAGRMGRSVAPLVLADPEFRLAGGTVRPGSALDGAALAHLTGDPNWDGQLTKQPAELAAICDVMVDFTTPESALAHARACAGAGCAFVSGTTGLDVRQRAELTALASGIPVFQAASFSLGIAAVEDALGRLAVTLATFDVAVIETHHTQKRDAPSGTALRLAESVRHVRADDIDVHALRLGGHPGEHTVLFGGDDEQVTISHQAFSRRAYATGAVLAVRFIAHQPAGLYGMSDLLSEIAGS